MFNQHNEIIQFVHDRFVLVSSQADCAGLSSSTLSRCMAGVRGLGNKAWKTYRRWLLGEYAIELDHEETETINGCVMCYSAPPYWFDWRVFVITSPDATLMLFERDGDLKQIKTVETTEGQDLREHVLDLQALADIELEGISKAENTRAMTAL